MEDLLPLATAGTFGCLLGLVFFVGLWLTVRQLERTRYPAVLALSSLLLRFGLVLASFSWLAELGNWHYLLAAITGFTIAQLATLCRLRPGSIRLAPRA